MALVYLVVESSTRAIYFPEKDAYANWSIGIAEFRPQLRPKPVAAPTSVTTLPYDVDPMRCHASNGHALINVAPV